MSSPPIASLVLLALLAALLEHANAAARVPDGRAMVIDTEMIPAPGKPGFAKLLEGMAVQVLEKKGVHVAVRTVGPVRFEGFVPALSVGLCAREQAPVRLDEKSDPVGFVPRGWCFRVLDTLDEHVRTADMTFGLNVLVEHLHLTARPEWRKRWNPILAGFVKYRIQAQPMPRKPGEAPYFTVPQGEWPMRAVHEQGEHAMLEILGKVVVLQGWERNTSLYQDLFREKDEVERARRLLAEQVRPVEDPRRWFTVRAKCPLYVSPGREKVGEVDAGVEVTVNRRARELAQIRIEPKDRRGLDLHRLDARLWLEDKYLFEPKTGGQ